MSPEFRFNPQDPTVYNRGESRVIEDIKELPYQIRTRFRKNEQRFDIGDLWFSQGKQKHATCLTWALVNAEYSLGSNLHNLQWAKTMHEKTLQRQTDRGLTKREAYSILSQFPERSIDFYPLPEDIALLPLFEWPPINNERYWKPNRRQLLVVDNNASIIKNIIDNDERLVTTILGGYDINKINFEKPIYHAVTISGYSTLDTGEMDCVQVIDPTYGILYPSLEHLSSVIEEQRDDKEIISWVVQRK